MNNLFKKELKILKNRMQERLIQKQEKHKGEWKTLSIDDLRNRLDFIYKLWFSDGAYSNKEEISLIDIMCQSGLLLLRLIEENKK